MRCQRGHVRCPGAPSLGRCHENIQCSIARYELRDAARSRALARLLEGALVVGRGPAREKRLRVEHQHGGGSARLRSALVAALRALHRSQRWASSPSSSSADVNAFRQSCTARAATSNEIASKRCAVWTTLDVAGVCRWQTCLASSTALARGAMGQHLDGELAARQQGQGEVLERLKVVAGLVAGAAAQAALQLAPQTGR